MNDNDFDFDQTARAWLHDGPTRVSDHALLSALEEIHTTRQRRALWPARRATPARIFGRVATAAVLVVTIGLLAVNVAPLLPDGSTVGGPSASPTPARSPDFPELTTTFVSPRNGFSIKHPDGAALTPAVQLWGFGENVDDGFDVVETGMGAVFKGASTGGLDDDGLSILDGASIDRLIDRYVSDDAVLPGRCGVPRSQQAEITIDGQPGRFAECPSRIESTVVADGRLYLFTLSHDRSDARAIFVAFVATIDLTPETAVDFAGLTATFVSPAYGYSVRYFRGIRAATELWDPSNQPLEDINLDPRFDANETGLGAYFEGASTPIPDGVSIDAWVDESITPVAAGGCGVPRSQQAEIIIDGRSGRVAECPNRIEATVVADGRLYLFNLEHRRDDARAWFDAWVATIDLRPGDAEVPSRSPAS